MNARMLEKEKSKCFTLGACWRIHFHGYVDNTWLGCQSPVYGTVSVFIQYSRQSSQHVFAFQEGSSPAEEKRTKPHSTLPLSTLQVNHVGAVLAPRIKNIQAQLIDEPTPITGRG